MHQLTTVSCALLLAAFWLGAPLDSIAAASKTYLLRAERTRGTVDLVEAAFEVGGDLKLIEDGKVEREKMRVDAHFSYEEKSLPATDGADRPLRSIRYYLKAEGTVQSGEYTYQPRLRDERRLIGAQIDGPEVTVFSPRGPLSSEELELVDVQANSLLLDRMLPARAVAVGSSWKIPDDLIAAVLGLEAVTNNEAASVLKTVADGRARIETAGRVAGRVRGAATQIELKGIYYFDLRSKRITWFGLLIRENRSIGHIDTGFEAVARLQMRITPSSRPQHLTDSALAGVTLTPTEALTQLSYESAESGWCLSHDRRWFVISDGKDRAVLRRIDGGDRVAQCNVAWMPQAAEATEATLEDFQKDVARALGENFKTFVRASQRHSKADYRVFRVVAAGAFSDVAMQWVYYQVVDRQGRRVVLAFVVEQDQLERFGQADEELVATLRLVEPKVASKPESRPQPNANPH
jgi:hypothetical protein